MPSLTTLPETPPDAFFVRASWTDSRNVPDLARAAGVEVGLLRRLAVKELADNALDADPSQAALVEVEVVDAETIRVSDRGQGLDPAELPRLLTVSRDVRLSSKYAYRVTRGMLGDGLRFVAGCVLAGGGELKVRTRGRWYHVRISEATGVAAVEPGKKDRTARGMAVELRLPLAQEGIPRDVAGQPECWGRQAVVMAGVGGQRHYTGGPSPRWYAAGDFYELAQASDGRTVRNLLSEFAGLPRNAATKAASGHGRRLASDLTREEAADLLRACQAASKPVHWKKLGKVGKQYEPEGGYAIAGGYFELEGAVPATVPFLVEAWACRAEEDELLVLVNRTPVAEQASMSRLPNRTHVSLTTCDRRWQKDTGFRVGRAPVSLRVSILAPRLSLLSEAKVPDLNDVVATMRVASERAASRLSRISPLPKTGGNRDARNEQIVEAARAELAEDHPQTLRQVYYRLVAAQVLPNEREAYKLLSHLLVEARKAKAIPWEHVEDRLRRPRSVATWGGVEAFGRGAVESYRRDVMSRQRVCVECWVEKDSLSALFESALAPYAVTLNVGRGYDSWSSLREAARRYEGKREVVILYFGDFDPSGVDMVRSLRERLGFFGCKPEIVVCALTPADIEQYQLPPAPTKTSDGRRAAFIEAHGDNCVELDALPASALRSRIVSEVEKRFDLPALAAVRAAEGEDRKRIAAAFGLPVE